MVTNGLATLPAPVAMENLAPGIRLCGIHGTDGCFDADSQGRLLLNVTSHEPHLLVQQAYKRSELFFWPLDVRPVGAVACLLAGKLDVSAKPGCGMLAPLVP